MVYFISIIVISSIFTVLSLAFMKQEGVTITSEVTAQSFIGVLAVVSFIAAILYTVLDYAI